MAPSLRSWMGPCSYLRGPVPKSDNLITSDYNLMDFSVQINFFGLIYSGGTGFPLFIAVHSEKKIHIYILKEFSACSGPAGVHLPSPITKRRSLDFMSILVYKKDRRPGMPLVTELGGGVCGDLPSLLIVPTVVQVFPRRFPAKSPSQQRSNPSPELLHSHSRISIVYVGRETASDIQLTFHLH